MKQKRMSLFFSIVKRWFNKYEWPIIIFLGVLSIILGYTGFCKELPGNSKSASVSDIL